jgi:hypothetical protein
MTATARTRSRRGAATAEPPPEQKAEPKKALLTGLRLTRHLRDLRHRAAVLDFLGGQLGPWFIPQPGFAPTYMIQNEDGALERARLAVVCRLAVELAAMAEQAHERVRKLLAADIHALGADDAPADDGAEEPGEYTPDKVASTPRAKA